MSLDDFLAEWRDSRPTVLVHTSGSTGEPKPMLVEKRRMEASARKTCAFLGLKEGDTALLCMSLDYIAGKMMVVRALTCGLRLISVEPSGHPLKNPGGQSLCNPLRSSHDGQSPCIDFAAMVPMQVWNSLQVPEERERLMQIGHLIIGGGAIDEALAAELRDFPNAVWSTYGMTETLSHIALRRLNGPTASDWYTPFEGVGISLNDEGCLVIDAPTVHDGPLITNDIAELHSPNIQHPTPITHHPTPITHHPSPITHHPSPLFRILGRKDNTICSGGVKIQAEEVERLLRAHLREPYLISKRQDQKFGEAVVLLTESTDLDAVASVCRQVLPRYWQPRHYVHVDRIPLTATGKPARHEAERQAAKQ